MKGDLALLGAVGAAMVAVPAAVLLWSGQPLLAQAPPALPVSLPSSQTAPGEGDGLNQGAFSTPAPGSPSSSEPEGDSRPVEGDEGPQTQEALPDTVKGVWRSPVTTLRILDQGSGEVVELSLADYTRYAIAAEMPASYHLEALKAQGVAALTYALQEAIAQRSLPEEARDPKLKGADFAADPGDRRGYMTEATAREFYGEQFDYSWNRITQAARAACRCVALYDGEPIAAAYHAISAGDTTERAENIWNGPLPYLVEAESNWDILAPGYKRTLSVTAGALKELLTAAGATFPVKVLMSYNPSTANWDKQCQIIEQQMEEALGADYIDIVLEAGPSTNFLSEVRKAGKYALMLCNWGPDYADPETYTDPWSLGFTYSWPELCTDPAYESGETYTAEDAAALGLDDKFIGAKVKTYNKMVDAAKAEKLDISARYNKFAEAEAYFIDHAFIIPFAVKNDGYCVNKISPFDRPFAPFGVSSLKFKGAKLLEKPMSLEEYQAAEEQWNKEREAAMAAG